MPALNRLRSPLLPISAASLSSLFLLNASAVTQITATSQESVQCQNDDRYNKTEVIYACSAIITSSANAHLRAVAYLLRGIEYNNYRNVVPPDLPRARVDLDNAITLDASIPSDDQKLTKAQRAKAYAERGDVDMGLYNPRSSLPYYDKAIEINLTSSDLYASRALARRKLLDFEGSLEDYNEAIRLDNADATRPSPTTAYHNLFRGYALLERGIIHQNNAHTNLADTDFLAAYANFRQAVDLYGKKITNDIAAKNTIDIDGHYRRFADAYLAASAAGKAARNDAFVQSDIDNALRYYEAALQISPRYAEALNGRGQVYLSQGKRMEAIAEFNKAITLKPDFASAYANRGEVYRQQKELVKAQAEFLQALKIDPHNQTAQIGSASVLPELAKLSAANAPVNPIPFLQPPVTLPSQSPAAKLPTTTATTTVPLGTAQTLTERFDGTVPSKNFERRVALVLGINKYPNLATAENPERGQLVNPRGDADLMAVTLKNLHFDVVTAYDVGLNDFWGAITAFTSKLGPNDTAVIYYSGHGFSIGGANLFAPNDIKLSPTTDENQLIHMAIKEIEVADLVRAKGIGAFLLIDDACRNNPFMEANVQSGLRGLGRDVGTYASAVKGTLAVYSASFGEEALDSDPTEPFAKNSVFMNVFAHKLAQPQNIIFTLEEVKREVWNRAHRAINKKTNKPHEQTVAYYNEMRIIAGNGFDITAPNFPATYAASYASSATRTLMLGQ
jgi:tetratricopeptide (TPR) repeat protein